MPCQVNHRDEWLACLRAAFEGLDRDKTGRISVTEIMHSLGDKLPESEVRGLGRGGRAGAACMHASVR